MCIQDSLRSYRTYTYTDLCLFRTPVGVTELILITDLCGFRTPVGVTELILITDLYGFRTPVGVTELILITDLCGFRTPVGVTELRLMLQSLFEGTRRYHRDYETYTGISEHILVLRNLYLYY